MLKFIMNKSDFPIFTTHPKLVYLDNAATSQKPQIVIDSIRDFYTSANANVHRGIHKLAEQSTLLFEHSRQTIADYIHAEKEEIIFTSGTTEALNLIAQMLTLKYENVNEQKVILLSEMEHHANILPWQLMGSRLGWKLEYIKTDSGYRLDLKGLQAKLNSNTAILALTQMSNVLGTINPVDEICSIAKSKSPQITTVIDGAQYLAHDRINLTESNNIDFYAFSGHKMLGPTGIGVLYGRQELLNSLEPVKRGGGMITKVDRDHSEWAELPEKFEAGTPNIEGAIGLAAAIEYLSSLNHAELSRHLKELNRHMLNQLKTIPELKLYGPSTDSDRGSVFSFSIEGIHPHDLAQLLDEDDIAVRAGHHCAQILHREVIKAVATTRASLYFYNESEDIDKLVESLKKIILRFSR